VVVHKGLAKLVREKAPWAVVLPFDNFMNIPAFELIMKALQTDGQIEEVDRVMAIISIETVQLHAPTTDKEGAIRLAGELLVKRATWPQPC